LKKIIFLLAFFIQSIASQAQLSFDYRLLIDFPSVNTNKFKLIDLDSDGDLDIFTGAYFLLNEKGSFVLDSINVFEQTPDLNHNYLPYTYLISRGLYIILDIEDSNGDGIFEMFILNIKQKRIEVKVNYKKTNEFFDSGLSFLNYDKLVFFDADNDGYKDFVLGNEDGIVIYQNSILFNREIIPIYYYVYSGASKQTGTGELIVNDFNKDGELDIFNGSIFFYKKPFKSDFEVSGTLNYQNIPFSIRNIQVADVTNSAFPSLMGDIDFNKSKIPFTSYILNQKDSVFQNYRAQNASDLDNDGLLDYIFIENNILKYKTKNGNFNFNQTSGVQIDAIKYIGDIDQNGFLDIIATSKTEIYLLTQKNVAENAAPVAPKLNTSLNGNILEISWAAGKDDKTPLDLLQYNLTITATDRLWLAPFPVLSSNISNKQAKPIYVQESSFKANVGYVLSKNIALNYEVEEMRINISAIDSKGRISTPAFSTLTYNFHPFELSVDSIALGTNNTPFELSVADMDSDGSMDFLVQKKNIQDSLKCYFKNAASWKTLDGTLTKAQSNSQIADFGNTGNLDLVLENASKALEKGSFNISKDAFETSSIANLSTANAFKYVFDADSDGDLDLFVSNDSLDLLSTSNFLIYNKTGQFESPIATDKLILHSSDFNDDGENDVLTLKKIKDGFSISLLIKRDTSYLETQTNLYKLSGITKHLNSIQIERFDVNGDGVFELVIQEKEASVCAILERNFSGGFSQTNLFTNSNFVFADYNNDGLIDLFDLISVGIYQNQGDFNFKANRYIPTFKDIFFDIKGAANNYKATIAVDFDGDSLTDFVSVEDEGLMFFKNNLSVDKNKAPSIPQNLKAETFEDTVSLTWQKSVDKDSVGLFYNIQLWKKETNQFLTPVHSLTDGRLLLNGKYTSISNKHVYRHLTDGTYFWKVQAIDAGNLPSEFSEVGSFEVVIKPTISVNKTACNHDIDTFFVSPTSKHYAWQVAGGMIIGGSDTSVHVKWNENGFQQLKISNTKFQLYDSTTIEVKNNPFPTINYHFPDSNSVLKLLFETNYSDSIKTYNWNINNRPYSEAKPIHLFDLPGKYNVFVNIEYKNGCKTNEIEVIDLFYPKIEGNKIVCGTSEEIYTANPKGPEYEWRVEGGLVLSKNNESINVKWDESTTLTKSVKLVNTKYQYADSIKIDVFFVPKADFEVPENIGISSLIQFQNTSTGTIATYSWDFDETNNTSTEKNPVTSFSVQGQHKVHLLVTNNVGCKADITKVVIVSDKVSYLTIANLLTPNSDGKNDHLYIENIERYPENEVKLYTAWGTEIFSQANYQNDWDLRKGDEFIPSGNYLCVVELKKFGKRFEKIVTVTR
jgi:gliding motility-associated-like protein